MSKLMRIQTDSDSVLQTMDYQAIFKVQEPSFYQIEKTGTAFVPSSTTPGSRVVCDILFNGEDTTREENHFIRYNVETSDATNHGTFLMECFTHWSEIIIEPNDSPVKIELKGLDFIMNILSDELKEYGLSVYEYMAKFRDEWDTFAGTEVTNASSKRFHFPLEPFIKWIKGLIPNGFLYKLRVTLVATPAATNAKDTAVICKSNTTSNPYTKATVSFTDIEYIRCYTVLRDQRLLARPPVQNVRILLPQYETKIYENVSWTTAGTDKVSFKLSEVGKRSDIQSLTVFVRPTASAYNSASAGKRYSGWNYILWKVRELAGKKFELDFTDDEHQQKLYDLGVIDNRYGVKYPDSVWKDSTDLTRYYLNMTNIHFDYNKIEPQHNEIVNTLSSDIRDFQIDLVCNGSVGASCDVVIMLNYYKILGFNERNQLYEVK